MAQSDDLYKELFRWDQKFSVLSFNRQESAGLKQLTEMTGGRYLLVENGFAGLRTAVADLVNASEATVNIEYDFRDSTDDYANSLKTTTAETVNMPTY